MLSLECIIVKGKLGIRPDLHVVIVLKCHLPKVEVSHSGLGKTATFHVMKTSIASMEVIYENFLGMVICMKA